MALTLFWNRVRCVSSDDCMLGSGIRRVSRAAIGRSIGRAHNFPENIRQSTSFPMTEDNNDANPNPAPHQRRLGLINGIRMDDVEMQQSAARPSRSGENGPEQASHTTKARMQMSKKGIVLAIVSVLAIIAVAVGVVVWRSSNNAGTEDSGGNSATQAPGMSPPPTAAPATTSLTTVKAVSFLQETQDQIAPLSEQQFKTMIGLLDFLNSSNLQDFVNDTLYTTTLLLDCDDLVSDNCQQTRNFLSNQLFPKQDKRRSSHGDGSVESKVTNFRGIADSLRIVNAAGTIPQSLNYAEYPIHDEYPDQDLSSMMKLLDGIPPIGLFLEGRKVVRLLMRLVVLELALPAVVNFQDDHEAYYSSLFQPETFAGGVIPNPLGIVPEPRVATTFEEDAELARQFLAGTNPVMIRRCLDPQNELTPNLLSFLSQQQDLNVTGLVSENRLYYATYQELADLSNNPHDSFPDAYNGDNSDINGDGVNDNLEYFFFPAVIVFVLEADDVLDVAAIQLNVDESAPVYSRDTSTDEEWLFAKMAVQNADAQFHQWVNHLGASHLTVEPHLIAIHNVLRREQHPIYDFLQPMTRDTFWLNWAARSDSPFGLASFARNSFADTTSSIGTGQAVQLIRNRWLQYDFFNSSGLPSELASRGFDENFTGLPGYYYQMDGLKLWNAYGQFAIDYVDEVYETDADVTADVVLQEWAEETTDPSRGDVPGFPTSFNDKVTLASTLQVLLWIAGGLHAALNFPQYNYYGFIPNKPLSLEHDPSVCLASDVADQRDCLFRQVLPNKVNTDRVITTAIALTTPSDYPINGLSDHYNSTQFGQESYAKFLQVLQALEDEIDERNNLLEQQGKVPYPYLRPSNVPAAIDI